MKLALRNLPPPADGRYHSFRELADIFSALGQATEPADRAAEDLARRATSELLQMSARGELPTPVPMAQIQATGARLAVDADVRQENGRLQRELTDAVCFGLPKVDA